MILVDVHAHLDHKRFKKDLDQVILRAKNAGVKSIITAGVNSSTNRIALKIAEKYDIVKPSLGIYPIDALDTDKGPDEVGLARDMEPIDIDKELKWIEKNKDKCIAIGEVGLDYKIVKGKEKEQKKNFQKIINTAEKINKPIIVHSRKAESDAVEMLESSKLKKVVMHCFNGKKSLIKRSADNGWYFSIPPIINRLQHFQMLAEIVNINKILTETDSPWLGPNRGERNEPVFVKETIKEISKIKDMDQKEVANNIYMNYTNVFL